MRHDISKLTVLTLLIVSVLALQGCAAKSPAEQVAETRTHYKIQQITWLPQEQLEAEPSDELAEGELAADEEEAAEPEEGGDMEEEMGETDEMVAEGPQPTDILFDIVLNFAGRESLPGITLDITHADPFEKQKEIRRHYVETEGMLDGDVSQLSFVLEDFQFEPGDVFSVEIRQNVPPEERGEYREFAAAGAS